MCTGGNEKLCDVVTHITENKTEKIAFFSIEKDHQLMNSLLECGFNKLYLYSNRKEIFDQEMSCDIKCSIVNLQNTHLPSSMFKLLFFYHKDLEKYNFGLNREILSEMSRIIINRGFLVIHTSRKEPQRLCKDDNQLSDCVSPDFSYVKSVEDEDNAWRKLRVENGMYYHFYKLYKNPARNKINKVHIVAPTFGMNEGQSEYAKALYKKFTSAGIEVEVVKTYDENWRTSPDPVIFEYEAHLGISVPNSDSIIMDVHYYSADDSRIGNKKFVLLKESIETINSKRIGTLRKLLVYTGMYLREPKGEYLYFKNGIINAFRRVVSKKIKKLKSEAFNTYFVVPHIDWGYNCQGLIENKIDKIYDSSQLCLGTFGFATPPKRIELICRIAKKLKIKAKILLSIVETDEKAKIVSTKYVEQLIKEYKDDLVDIRVGFFEPCEIIRELSACSHIVFCQTPDGQTSGSMRLAALAKRPVIALDSLQSRDAQAHIVRKISEITKNYLLSHNRPILVDDGFDYLINFLLFDYKSTVDIQS